MTDVNQLISEYKTTIPVDIENLIINLGIDLDSQATLGKNISGQIKKDKETGTYSISVNGEEHIYRRRFTMAHELGHFILHKSILDQAGWINDSVMYRAEKNAPAYNSKIKKIHEQQANSFAANLLMPEQAVKDKHNDLSVTAPNYDGKPSLTELYRYFSVSPSAMKWRLKNLDLEYNE